MAIRPSNKYPAQTATDGTYPYGKAQNCLVAGDGTGTPLEADLVNDIFGFQQALLGAAAIAPSDTPDTASVSQYLLAVRYVATHPTGIQYAPFGLFSQDVNATGNLSVGGLSFFGGLATFDAATFDGLATFNLGVQFNIGNVVFAGPLVSFANAVTLAGATTVTGEIILQTAGRIRKRHLTAADGDTTYDVTEADIINIPGSGISASRTYSIAVTGASTGSEIEFRNYDTVHTHSVKPVGGSAVVVPVAQAGGFGVASIPSILRASFGNGNALGTKWEVTELITA